MGWTESINNHLQHVHHHILRYISPAFVLQVVTHRNFLSSKVLTLGSCCPPPVGDIGYCFIPFNCRESSALGKQSDANKFTLNKDVISLLISFLQLPCHCKNCLAQLHFCVIDNPWCKYALIGLSLISEGHTAFPVLRCIPSGVGTCSRFQSPEHAGNVFCFCGLLVPRRLKKKSQSVDIASQGFSPTLVPASPLNKAAPPVAKTTTVLAVQENNTTNSQRRSPRCGELKRGYTIGKWHRGWGSYLFVCVATDDAKSARSCNNLKKFVCLEKLYSYQWRRTSVRSCCHFSFAYDTL